MHDTGIVFLKAKAYVAVGRFNGTDFFYFLLSSSERYCHFIVYPLCLTSSF